MPFRPPFQAKPLAQAVLFTLAAGAAGLAGATTCTWNGAASNLWSGTNWSGCAGPTSGDTAVFGFVAANPANTNDIAGLDLAGIDITGGGYVLTLGSTGLTGDVNIAAGTWNQFAGTLTQKGGATHTYSVASGATLQLITTLALGDDPAIFSVSGTLNVSAGISGGANASLTFNQTGFTSLSGNNTFDGALFINAGTVEISGAQPLGSSLNPTNVAANATLMLNGIDLSDEPMYLSGGSGDAGAGQVYLSATSVWRGPVFLSGASGDATFNVPAAGRSLTLPGSVSGPGGITLIGPGTLVLSETSKSFSGPINLNTDGAGGVLRIANGADLIPDSATLNFTNLSPLATFDVNGLSEAVGDIQGQGKITLGSGTLTVGGNGSDSDFYGVISGSGQLVKIGPETLTLSGANSFTGGTHVNGGTLWLNGAGTLGTTHVASGAGLEIGRAATLGDIHVASGGTLRLRGGVDTGHAGHLYLASGSTLSTSIANSNPTLNGGVNVQGTVNLDGVNLNVELGYTPIQGATFMLIDNDGPDAVNGTFAGLPQGAGLVVNGVTFYLDYQGGDGNDVVLSTVAVAAGAGSPGGVEAIPTLSEWGRIILSLAVSWLSLSTWRRRGHATS